MKIYKVLAFATLALSFAACDPVDENERYSEATEINKDHKVLIEEFTGQYCPNCPLGHEALDGIKKMYPDNAVIVSIHAGSMAFDDPTYGLKTPDGDKYAATWGIQEYPSAVVNRNGGSMSDRSQWQGAVFMSAVTPPSMKIDLEASVKDNKIVVTSQLKSTDKNIDGKYQLWITESNIVGLQLNGGEYRMDYVHNHVYRASVNGVGGEDVSFGNDGVTLNHTIDVASNWNIDNLNVVAFVYNSKGVLQAEEIKVNK